jgi:hypothetical protein
MHAKADPLLLGLSSDLAEVSIAEFDWGKRPRYEGLAEAAPFSAESCIACEIMLTAQPIDFGWRRNMLGLLDG